MSTILNSFTIDPIKGQLTLDPNFNTFSCQVVSTQVGALVPAQAVAMADVAGAQIPVLAAAAVTDNIFGFVASNFKVNEYEALDLVKIATNGAIVYMEASAAIARGANLQIVVSGSKVVTATTGTIIGKALDKAAANGDLIRVLVDIRAQVTLDSLSDVTLTTPTNTQVLKYNGTIWVNAADAT